MLKITLFGCVLMCAGFAPPALAGPTPIDLNDAGNLAVFASSTITNTGSSVIDGNVGLWPGTAVTGFPPGQVVDGTIYAADTEA
jgi:hypothetical protein